MASVLEATHPKADADCEPCDGSGYVRVREFDPLDGSLCEATDICECVLKALGDGE